MPKQTWPFTTAAEALTQVILYFHFCWPVAASTAYTLESRQPKYTTPSTTAGEETIEPRENSFTLAAYMSSNELAVNTTG